MPVFTLIDRAEDGDHSFAVYDCHASTIEDLIEDLAGVVQDLYVNPENFRSVLQGALSDVGGLPGEDALNEAIDRTLAAAIPEPGTHKVPQLDVARNELAEVLAYLALPAIHTTVIPASRIRNKEIPGAPARGLDLVGLEDPPLVAVVGEVKASDEANSPPAVVDTGDDSLRGQFLSFLSDEDRLLAELNWALKHARPENVNLVARALTAHVAGTLPVVAAPVLVRPANRHGPGDFGSFKQNPAQFDPADVRFCLLRVPGDLDEFSRSVYEKARG